jgi:hypothetical protein
MAEYRMTNFIVALIFVGLIMFGFMLFAGTIQKQYSTSSSFDANATLNKYDKTGQLVAVVNKTDAAADQTGNAITRFVNDIAGKIFGDAYNAFKTTKAAYNSFDDMADESTEIPGIGQYAPYFKAIVWVVIILGIVLTALLGRDI